jgi:hypothetical protein
LRTKFDRTLANGKAHALLRIAQPEAGAQCARLARPGLHEEGTRGNALFMPRGDEHFAAMQADQALLVVKTDIHRSGTVELQHGAIGRRHPAPLACGSVAAIQACQGVHLPRWTPTPRARQHTRS